MIEHIKTWDEMSRQEILEYNKYLMKVINTYFKMKGLMITDQGIAQKDDEKMLFHYESKSSGFSIVYNELYSNKTIYIMRYHDYPIIDNDYWVVTSTPNPIWVLGFVERIILSIDYYLFNIIREKGEEYNWLVNDTNRTLLQRQKYSPKVITGEAIRSEEMSNLKKGFYPSHLSCFPEKTKEISTHISTLLDSFNSTVDTSPEKN